MVRNSFHTFVTKAHPTPPIIMHSGNMVVRHEKGTELVLDHYGNNDNGGSIGPSVPFTWTHYMPKNGKFTYKGDISGTFIHRGSHITVDIESNQLAFDVWPVNITVLLTLFFLSLSLSIYLSLSLGPDIFARFLQRRTKQKQVNFTSNFKYDYGKTNAESPTHITISNVGPAPSTPNTQALIDISSSHSVLNLPSTGTNYLFHPLFPPSLLFYIRIH